jgi:MFS family permease
MLSQPWRVTFAGGAGVFFTSLYVLTFPVLLKPLADEFSWSREAVSRAYAAMTLAVAVSAPFIGQLVDRLGPRRVVGPLLVVPACAFASLALLTANLWHLYAVFLVIGLAVPGNSPVVYSRVVATWFDDRRGLALAVIFASAGVGAIVHPAVGHALIGAFGWRTTCLTLGCLVLLVGLPIVTRFVREPERVSRTGATPEGGVLGRALRSRIFWTLIAVVLGTTVPMSGVIVHLAALLTDRGVPAGRAVIAVSVAGGASLMGRLLTGWLIDRFVAPRVTFVLLATASIGTFLLAGTSSFTVALVAAALIGFGTGGEVDVIPYLLSRYFGLGSLATLYGLAWTAFGLAGAAGPVVMGRAFDGTGSYERVLLWFAGALAGGAALMLTLPVEREKG